MIYVVSGLANRIKFAREAAQVHRTHATPPPQPYTVGMHTVGMLFLLRILYPDAPRSLIWAILEHDAPERITCDMSHPAKMMGLLNKTTQTQMEEELNQQVFGEDTVQRLSQIDLQWLKGLDMLEFYCWTKDQLMLGNRTVETQKRYVEKFMKKNAACFPTEILDAYYIVKNSEWQTLPDMEDHG